MSRKDRRAKRIAQNPAPGKEDRFEEGERIVDDPFEPGKRYAAKVNVRECSVAHMVSRGRLDKAQEAACERFRSLWELAAIGRQRGIDLSGGGGRSIGAVSDPLSDELVRAGRILATTIERLGPRYSRLMVAIVGEGKPIGEIAKRWAMSGGIVKGK